jgi:acetyl esterase/lipase
MSDRLSIQNRQSRPAALTHRQILRIIPGLLMEVFLFPADFRPVARLPQGTPPGEEVPGYAVPARAADLAGLPPAFITVGNLDGLLDEGVDYARRLVAAGVPADLHVFAGGPHAFDSMLAGTAVAQRAGQVLEDWLESGLHPVHAEI